MTFLTGNQDMIIDSEILYTDFKKKKYSSLVDYKTFLTFFFHV